MRERNQSANIQIDLLYLLRKRRVEEAFENPESGVVDQDIYVEITTRHFDNQMIDPLGRRKVCRQNGDLSMTLFPQPFRQSVQLVLGASYQDKVGTLCSQLSCKSLAQTGRSACNQCSHTSIIHSLPRSQTAWRTGSCAGIPDVFRTPPRFGDLIVRRSAS